MNSGTKTSHKGLSRFVVSRALRLVFLVTLTITGVTAVPAQADEKKPDGRDKTDQTARERNLPFTLRVTDDQIIGVSLKAQDIRLKDIAVELSRRLKIPVILTPIIEKHSVTVNFSDLVLEPAMQMLAPQVYIDYEIDTSSGQQPRPLAIYLQGYNERPPADTAVVKGNSDVMVIEGDTEDDGVVSKSEEKEQELRVTVESGLLSVKSKKQPLIVVLYGIANQLGIPLEVRNETTDLVNLNIVNATLESVLRELGANMRLYVRADLQIGDRRPLRMVLVGSEKKS